MKELIWYGNGGHFCGLSDCQFHLCTEVGDYLISTVGEYYPDGYKKGRGMCALGLGEKDLYETMVFRISSRCQCGCGLPNGYDNIETFRYATPKEANEKHRELCEKYRRKRKKNVQS